MKTPSDVKEITFVKCHKISMMRNFHHFLEPGAILY